MLPKKTKKNEVLKPKKIKSGTKAKFWDSIQIKDEREYFIENLSMLLASGMDIMRTLNGIRSGVHSGAMKRLIGRIQEDIDNGSPLWKALSKTNLLPEHILALFRIGEESGQLAKNLQVINLQQQKERSFHSKIRSAMMYPVFVLVLTLVIGIGIAWFILPRLASIFGQ